MKDDTTDSANPVLTFEGKKYFINELSLEIQESIKDPEMKRELAGKLSDMYLLQNAMESVIDPNSSIEDAKFFIEKSPNQEHLERVIDSHYGQ